MRLENKRDIDKLDWVPQRATEMVRTYEERYMKRGWGSWVRSVRRDGSGKSYCCHQLPNGKAQRRQKQSLLEERGEGEATVTSWNVRNSDWTLGKTFSFCGWPNRAIGCAERLLNLQLCRYSKLIWISLWITSSNGTYFEWGFRLDDLQRSFPT